MTRIRGFVLMALLLGLWATSPARAEDIVVTADFDGRDRQFTVHIPPSYDGSQPVPLVIALHFYGGTGSAMQTVTNFNALADEAGFIVVFPDGIDGIWEAGLNPVADDVGFIEAIIHAHKARYNIDERQVYVTGFSLGGVMAYRLACDLAGSITAVGVVAAAMPQTMADRCAPAMPVSMIMVMGTADPSSPWDSQAAAKNGLISVPDTVAFWSRHNACQPGRTIELEADTAPDDGTRAWAERYTDCAAGTGVTLYRVEGGGHNWPGSAANPGASMDIDATRVLWDFFSAHASDVLAQDEPEQTPVVAERPPLPHYAMTRDTLVHDGLARTYDLYVPPAYAESATGLPLVITLHTGSSSGLAMAALSGLNRLADENGFIAVYPNSMGQLWDDGRAAAGVPPAFDAIDDAGFITGLVDSLAETYPVDRSRVYLAGFGHGGGMAYRLACQQPDRFAGVAVVAALMWDYHQTDCSETGAPVNLLIMHGDADERDMVDGRTFPDADYRITSRQETLDFWRARAKCPAEAVSPAENITLYTGCDQDTRLALYQVAGGGHNWPRTGHLLVNTVDASAVLWQFFNDSESWASAGLPDQSEAQADTALPRGRPRSFLLYVPSTYDDTRPTPLVIALHGRPGNGLSFSFITDLNAVAEKHNFIVVYPDGLDGQWDYITGLPNTILQPNSVDDVGFLSTLADDLALDLNIDPDRLYVTGFSNGGFMTHRMACELNSKFAAFAPVGGTMPVFFGRLCTSSRTPIPMVMIHGTDDRSVTWEALTETVDGEPMVTYLSAPDTVSFWVTRDACDPNPEVIDITETDRFDGTRVQQFVFSGCTGQIEVVFYAVIGGGHNWPGVPGVIEDFIAGAVNTDINAGEVIWRFFEQHPRSSDQSR